MANHTLTSNSGVVTGSAGSAGTGVITITFPAIYNKKLGGFLYVQMYGTCALVLTPNVINKRLSGTAQYNVGFGTAGVLGSFGTSNITIGGGNWNTRIPLQVTPNENSIVISAAFGAGSGGVAVIDYEAQGDFQ